MRFTIATQGGRSEEEGAIEGAARAIQRGVQAAGVAAAVKDSVPAAARELGLASAQP